MPFYFAREQIETYDDCWFLQQELTDCFVVNNQELRVFVLDDPYITNTDTINFINSDQIDIVVHVVVTHPWNFNCMAQHIELVNITKPWIQITWDDTAPASDNFVTFDYWAGYRQDLMYVWGQDHYVTNCNWPRRYTFSCINNVAKAHRICMLYHLYGGDLWNRTLVSMGDTYLESPVATAQPISYHNVGSAIREHMGDQYDQDQFQHFYDLLPIKCPQESSMKIPFWIHDAFANSYVNIVTEHDFETNFASEKSIKPFLTEQIAVFVAGPGLVARLRRIGLDVFDDIVDHSYDTEPDDQARMKKIFQSIHGLADLDWEKIYASTQSRRQKNRSLLRSNKLFDDFRTLVTKKIHALLS